MNCIPVTLLAAYTQDEVLNDQCVVVEHYDSIKEARGKVGYVLSEEFQLSSEMSRPLGYAQIRNAKGEVLFDFFGKGH